MTLSFLELLALVSAPLVLLALLAGVAGWLLWRRLRTLGGVGGGLSAGSTSLGVDLAIDAPAYGSSDEGESAPALSMGMLEGSPFARPKVITDPAERERVLKQIAEVNQKMAEIDAELETKQAALAEIPQLLSGGVDDPLTKRMMRITWADFGLCIERAVVTSPIDTCEKFTPSAAALRNEEGVGSLRESITKECSNCANHDVPAGARALRTNPAFLHMTTLKAPHELLAKVNPKHLELTNDIARRSMVRNELDLQRSQHLRALGEVP